MDAGKTMREQCIRLLPRHGVRSLDALLLTHAHADAIHGLDDIRDFQQQGTRHLPLPPLPVYATNTTFTDIKRRFGYLVPGAGSQLEVESAAAAAAAGTAAAASSETPRGPSGASIKTNVRTVSKLDWRVVPEPPLGVPRCSHAADEGRRAEGGGERVVYEPLDVPECSGLAITPLPVPLQSHGPRGRDRRAAERGL